MGNISPPYSHPSGIEQHSLDVWRVLGGASITGGVVRIAMF